MNMTRRELADWMKQQGESSFRGGQVYDWLMRGADFPQMTNLSAALRTRLSEIALANPVRIDQVHLSKIDETAKFLYELPDGNMIEGVLMRYHHGDTLCLSTQVGCKMGCKFCASTLDGCVRSLTPAEMLGQVVAANGYAKSQSPDRHLLTGWTGTLRDL